MQYVLIARIILILNVTASGYGCSNSSSISNGSDEAFRIISMGDVPEVQIVDITSVLSEEVPRILENYSVSNFPTATIRVWQDRNSFSREFGEDATNVRGFIDSADWEVHVLNTGAPLGRSALHEFVHRVSLVKNQGNGQIPIWLWEAVAIYESKRPPPPNPADLNCVNTTNISTLEALNNHPSIINRIGNLLTEFILNSWSYETLGELITTNGNLATTLNISEAEFEQMWLVYANTAYDLSTNSSVISQNC